MDALLERPGEVLGMGGARKALRHVLLGVGLLDDVRAHISYLYGYLPNPLDLRSLKKKDTTHVS
jgi:hypothetical protein